MRSAERLSQESGVSERLMVETAGNNAAQEIARLMKQQRLDGDISIFCGVGNNGADGLAAALSLHRSGYSVRVVLLAQQGQSPENDYFWECVDEELPAYSWHLGLADADLQYSVLLVDALFGIGLKRAFDEQLRAFAQRYNAAEAYKVALDIPSGIDADSGQILKDKPGDAEDQLALRADTTLSFFRAKSGHLLLPGREFCGQLKVLDCAIRADSLSDDLPTLWRNEPELWSESLDYPRLDTHKYQRAPVYLHAGSDYPGAGQLAGAGAQALGASYLAYAPDSQQLGDPSWVVLPHVSARIMRKYKAGLIGPGCLPSEQLRRAIARLLASNIPCVLDAGALSAFAADPHVLFELIHPDVVLTPHLGEFRQLFPALAQVDSERLQASRAAARLAACTVVLKGVDTVVASADGRAVINANASNKLATAGSGDVLSGAISALLAQGLSTFVAACAAVWMQGAAADKLQINSAASALPEHMGGVYSSFLQDKK